MPAGRARAMDPLKSETLLPENYQQLEEYMAEMRKSFDDLPSLVRYYAHALVCVDTKLKGDLEKEKQKWKLDSDQPDSNVKLIELSRRRLQSFQFEAMRNSTLLLDGNKLKESCRTKLLDLLKSHGPDVKDIESGVYVFQGGEGDMSLIVTPEQAEVILIDGTKTATCFKATWDSTLRYLERITHIVVTHHDVDHTFGIQLLLARYYADEEKKDLPDLSGVTIYINTRANFLRNFDHEGEIRTLAKKLKLSIKPLIVGDSPQKLITGDKFFVEAILPKDSLVKRFNDNIPNRGKSTMGVASRGHTTAANVLSINVVAVWNNKDAYLFTGDAHLRDVTEAAQDFLKAHPDITSFKYVDVPHHGSEHSNIKNVDKKDLGLASIPAQNYLISHCGNHRTRRLQQ